MENNNDALKLKLDLVLEDLRSFGCVGVILLIADQDKVTAGMTIRPGFSQYIPAMLITMADGLEKEQKETKQ